MLMPLTFLEKYLIHSIVSVQLLVNVEVLCITRIYYLWSKNCVYL